MIASTLIAVIFLLMFVLGRIVDLRTLFEPNEMEPATRPGLPISLPRPLFHLAV